MVERGDLPGFQKPMSSPPKAVGLAVISQGDYGRVRCSCGWGYQHKREKVREDAVDKHIESIHAGRGIRV